MSPSEAFGMGSRGGLLSLLTGRQGQQERSIRLRGVGLAGKQGGGSTPPWGQEMRQVGRG